MPSHRRFRGRWTIPPMCANMAARCALAESPTPTTHVKVVFMAEPMTGAQPDSSREDVAAGRTLPFGTLAFVGAIGSLTACYGTIAAEAFFGVPRFGINAHVQAVVMWGLGLLALFALWRDRRHHGGILPFLFAGIGVAVLLFTLYVQYESRFEVLAYILLLVGALSNQNAMVGALYGKVRQQALEIRDFNQTLEDKVRRQVGEIERLTRLKRFLAPQVAELVMAEGGEAPLDSHRRYIACLFCDIRNFTSLSESVEPEETIALLQAYHERVGDRVAAWRGTIGSRAGDGLMVFFNDPFPCDEPVLDAVRLGLEIRDVVQELRAYWHRLGHSIGVGVGIASGYATLGLVGDEERAEYTAIGNVVNLASRLCDQARDGEILVDQRAYLDIEGRLRTEARGPYALKGVTGEVPAYAVLGLERPGDEADGRGEPTIAAPAKPSP